jgi:hypothetical protein
MQVFNTSAGSADELLARMIKPAASVTSHVLHCLSRELRHILRATNGNHMRSVTGYICLSYSFTQCKSFRSIYCVFVLEMFVM